ncbi:zf-HC2 domain-containing protein [Streptomyces sp. P38-E01]|uniref:Zf-HC2 domain-containing protein n=1 Tax=Streptomyces tardus TaxID=2780544 RepID=A0A949JES1_9ACTN|nr:zf-HC2 domain-containing protein [Streptomyces tardus]MBU7598697.1 zf-HC2 domain-containing protein [Streptomyces tardus]
MTSLAHHQDHHDHHDVGAYAIGALDPEDAARFEEHLADCVSCSAELDELLGLAPLLDEYTDTGRTAAGASPRATGCRDGEALRPGAGATARPAALAVPYVQPVRAGEALLASVLARAAAERRRRARRRLALALPAAAVLVAAALGGAALLTGGDRGTPPDPIRAAYDAGEKHHGSAPGSDVDATVSLTEKRWGTEIAVRLTGVTGPRSCGLIAVGRDGGEQTVTTWAVPDTGYGPGKEVYYVGGSAYGPADIDHFEVRTLDGQRLVTVDK